MNGSDPMRLQVTWSGSWLRRVAVVLAVGLAAGCDGWSFSRPQWRNPFRRAEPVDNARYGPTPAERANELRELAEQARQMPAHQQQAVSQQLAQRLSQESDPLLRAEIVRTISFFAAPATLAAMQGAARDPDPQVRMAACGGWARVGGPESAQALAAIVRGDASIDVRLAAARAMGNLQEPIAWQALTEALQDEDPAMRRRAQVSLARATGQAFGSDSLAWRQFVQSRMGPAYDPAAPDVQQDQRAVAGRADPSPAR